MNLSFLFSTGCWRWCGIEWCGVVFHIPPSPCPEMLVKSRLERRAGVVPARTNPTKSDQTQPGLSSLSYQRTGPGAGRTQFTGIIISRSILSTLSNRTKMSFRTCFRELITTWQQVRYKRHGKLVCLSVPVFCKSISQLLIWYQMLCVVMLWAAWGAVASLSVCRHERQNYLGLYDGPVRPRISGLQQHNPRGVGGEK